jgi:thiamine-monophosphate kinase
MKRTEIGEIGEFGLIDQLSGNFKPKQAKTVMGIGDDAAVLDCGDTYMVITTDMLLEGVHFDLSYCPLKHLGFNAMNAIPKQVTVSLGISNRFSVEAVQELYQGIESAASHYNIDLVGGDTTTSRSGLVISVTAIGEVDKELVTYRSGAKKNDIICVTGDLGAAIVGLQVLERDKQVFLSNPKMQPELGKYEYVVGRQLKPDARMDIIHELIELKVKPSSMIDISDGLASELMHICKSSDKGVAIYEDKLPIDKQTYDTALEFNLDPVTCVLNGGEDYELLFTISQEDFPKLEKHPDIHFIGHVSDSSDGKLLVTKSGTTASLKAQGWKHF